MTVHSRPLAHKRILLCCYEAPGFGGASTQGYDLLRRMLADGINTSFVNLIDAQDREFFEYTFGEQLGNPDGLPRVYNALMAPSPLEPQPELAAIVQRVAPDVLLGIGYIATLALNTCVPDRELVFYAVGSSQSELLIMDGWARDGVELSARLKRGKMPRLRDWGERRAVAAANLIIVNSQLLKDLYLGLFGDWAGKIYPRVISTAEWTCEATLPYARWAKPFASREIDFLFVASSWDRPVKNYPMVRKIVSRFPNAMIHIAGDVVKPIAGAVHHGFISSKEKLLKLMANARTVVSPSIMDVEPGILFQASVMGCNVVTSENSGNWSLCNPRLLASSGTIDAFVDCITCSLNRKFPDNLEEFLQSGSYEDLIETLTAL